MEKFLSKVAKHILEKHGNNLSGVTVFTPNHRSCLYLKEALKEHTTQSIWSPEISTFQDWVKAQSELTVIEPLQQLLELYEVYKTKGGEETLDEFIPTAKVMLADFDEVDMQLANAKGFFRDLENLQSLKVYEPGEEPTEYTIRYRKFWQLFRELYFGFKEHLLHGKKAYTGMIYRDVAETNNLQGLSATVYFVGFNYLSHSEQSILRQLRVKTETHIIWDTDKYYIEDNYQEAGTFFRKYQEEWRVNNKAWQTDLIATGKKNIDVIGVAKNIGQAKVVADILANKLNLDADTEKQTAVVVLDEKLLNPLLAAIPANISALNISMGFPLRESPVAELLKAIFSLHDNIERFKSGSAKQLRFYYNDVFDLLHHPYAAYLIPDQAAASDFIEHMRSRNRTVIGYAEMEKYFKGTNFSKIFWYTSDVNEYLKSLLALVETLRIHFLQQTRDEAKDLSVDIELLFHINTVLQNLQNVVKQNRISIGNADEAVLHTPALRKLITETIRSVRIPFEGEPVRGLQLIGMLETMALDFKNVIIVSMNEGIFPSGKSQNSYIPFEMRMAYSLATHREKDASAAYLFYRLLQRAENVFLLFNTESDEMGGGERSRFILQLQHELKRNNSNTIINDLVYSVDPPPAIPDDDIVIAKDESVMKLLLENLTYGISPSAINTYINCSLQYYLRYIARLREQDDIEESIEASTLGSAVHYVLEHIYADVIGKELTMEIVERPAKDKPYLEQLLKESFSTRFDDESLKRGKNYLLYRVCLKLIGEFLKQEKRNLRMLHDAGSDLKLLMLEKDMEQPLLVVGHNIKVKGKVDRIEESNGIVSIADYKTGTPVGSSIKSDDVALFATDPKYAKAMQLLTYAWLYWRGDNARDIQLRSGIYWLRDIAEGLDSLKMDRGDIITTDILLQFEEVLKTVLGELLNTELPFSKTLDIERCAHCEFARICRRD